ncbi:hypothetical protein ACFWIB_42860 [Streptomyces sp. NPDC127051]|uniref:hypothetical protein n=1 Tax=Streptomyces sp. NPDC127051 TaxID=3347119 RepID=UPI00365E3F03
MATHVLTGAGTSVSTYSPAITASTATVSLQATTVFVPAVACADFPLRFLVSNLIQGTYATSCTGPITSPELTGTLHWSDSTTSEYTVTHDTAERVEGHLVGHVQGTITSGHYTGATVHALSLRLATNVAACLTGSSVSTSSGWDVLVVTKP